MQIGEIMTKEVDRVTPDTPIEVAARKMREDDVGALPVEQDEKLVGMVTDRDIVTRILGNGADSSTAHVSDAMTDRVYYVFDDDDAEAVALNMSDEQIRRMPVVNREKRLVGIVSLGDIATNAKAELSGQTLEGISTPNS